MRQIVSVLGSLAVGLLMAAAGLYYDVKTLAVAGAILFGLAAVLWLYEWGRTAPKVEAVLPGDAPILARENDQHKDDQARHIRIMRGMTATSSSVGYALGYRDRSHMAGALPGLRATLLTVAKAYDLQIPDLDAAQTERSLKAGAHYLTEVGAYLRQGHVDEARECAATLSPKLNEYVQGERASL
jgi:hypothetical protein